jgi:hypothetical protein
MEGIRKTRRAASFIVRICLFTRLRERVQRVEKLARRESARPASPGSPPRPTWAGYSGMRRCPRPK